MKPIYYVILMRPKGSSTWTPLHETDGLEEWKAGNYFASRASAASWIAKLRRSNHTTYLPGPQKRVTTEFHIGCVVIDGE